MANMTVRPTAPNSRRSAGSSFSYSSSPALPEPTTCSPARSRCRRPERQSLACWAVARRWKSALPTAPRSSAGWSGPSTEFAKTSDGKHIKVNLIPMGSLEGAHALLAGDQRINVWSPASAPTKTASCRSGRSSTAATHRQEEPLALTPMVFVIWDERYQAFMQKYKTMSLDTIDQALQAKGGWDAIAHSRSGDSSSSATPIQTSRTPV